MFKWGFVANGQLASFFKPRKFIQWPLNNTGVDFHRKYRAAMFNFRFKLDGGAINIFAQFLFYRPETLTKD
jgi:hypothetical protein